MSRRSKLIYLLSLNAILAAAVVALATVLLTGGGAAEQAVVCGADEPDFGDRFVPVNDTFDSIAEAEDFICHDVAYPRSTPGWMVESISASRSGPADLVGRGIGFASVTLDYMLPRHEDADMRLEVSPFEIDEVTYGIVDHVQIMDSQATLIQGVDQNHYIMQWQADGFSFYVEAHVTDSFDLAELYEILNSIE